MIWKVVSFGLVLWLVQYFLHLPVAITILVGLVALTALVAREIMIAQRLADVSQKSEQ